MGTGKLLSADNINNAASVAGATTTVGGGPFAQAAELLGVAAGAACEDFCKSVCKNP